MEHNRIRGISVIIAIMIGLLMGCSLPEATNAKAAARDTAVTKNVQEVKANVVAVQQIKRAIRRASSLAVFEDGEVAVRDLTASAVSVSCLEVKWLALWGREYTIEVETDAPFEDNITIEKKRNGLCYITGLRENSEYEVTLTPVLSEKEKQSKVVAIPATVACKTAEVTRQKEYEYEDGWTNCFAGERASGLTLSPSYDAIVDTVVDPVTGTGIRRNEYGDYCCAMGLWYGEVGDRFLVELENGIQFTVMICDSKGMADDADGDGEPDGRFHWYGGENEGKCIVEFIYEADYMPDKVLDSGSWGYYNWNGLDLTSNIKSIYGIAA